MIDAEGFRANVGIVICNNQGQVFWARRYGQHSWQFPQGGVDDGENFLDAALRELKEETSIRNVELIKEFNNLTTYELPNHLLGIIWKGKYRGQKQKWFLMRFTGDDNEININTKNPEFIDWKWIDLDLITDLVVDFKLHVYKEIKEKVKKIIN